MTGGTTGAYIARLDVDQPHLLGVAKKIDAQVETLGEAFGPVETWLLRGFAVERDGQTMYRQQPGLLARQRLQAVEFYRTILRQPSPPGFIYMRYQRCTPAVLWLLAGLKAQAPKRPIFVEIPTFPYDSEALTARDRLLAGIDRMTRPSLSRYVDRIVTFSGAPEIFGIPTIQTDNGVRLGDMQSVLDRPLRPVGEGLRIVGVANVSFYHGYDRVIQGMADHLVANPGADVSFDLIGSGRDLSRLRHLVARLGLEKQVRFLGPLEGGELDRRMSAYDLAVSSIGMHRVVARTSDLKSREYCARGLPFVIANPDPDFGPDFPFAYHAPMNDEPIDIASLLSFRDKLVTDQPDYPAKMHAYAGVRLTWRSKMGPVVEAIRELMPAER